jgi:hypothetical protein
MPQRRSVLYQLLLQSKQAREGSYMVMRQSTLATPPNNGLLPNEASNIEEDIAQVIAEPTSWGGKAERLNWNASRTVRARFVALDPAWDANMNLATCGALATQSGGSAEFE